MPELMVGLPDKQYIYGNILALTKCIFVIIKVAFHCFKEYINTMTLKVGFKKYNTYPCNLYITKKLKESIVIVCIYYTI